MQVPEQRITALLPLSPWQRPVNSEHFEAVSQPLKAAGHPVMGVPDDHFSHRG
jgi:hypothetical protein